MQLKLWPIIGISLRWFIGRNGFIDKLQGVQVITGIIMLFQHKYNLGVL